MPNPYLLLGVLVAFIGIAIGAFLYGEHVDSLAWQAKVAAQEVEAANLLTTATQAADAANLKAANLNTQIEADHATHAAALADHQQRIDSLAAELDRVRGQSGCRNGGPGPVPSRPSAAAQRGQAPANDVGPASGSFSALAKLMDAAVGLALTGEACHAFAIGQPIPVTP